MNFDKPLIQVRNTLETKAEYDEEEWIYIDLNFVWTYEHINFFGNCLYGLHYDLGYRGGLSFV